MSTIPIDWEASSSGVSCDTVPLHKIVVKWKIHVQRAVSRGEEVHGWGECVRASAHRVLNQWKDIESIRVSFDSESGESFYLSGATGEEKIVSCMRAAEWKYVQ